MLLFETGASASVLLYDFGLLCDLSQRKNPAASCRAEYRWPEFRFNASCGEPEWDMYFGIDTSQQLVGVLPPVINILSNHSKIKCFVLFQKTYCVFVELDV